MSRTQPRPATAVSREEYRALDNRISAIFLKNWTAREINEWVHLLSGKQQAIACAILRRRHPRPAQLNLPAVGADITNPFQAKSPRPTVPMLSADGRYAGKHHVVAGLTPVSIDPSGTIRNANTGHALWIAPGSITDRANPGAADQLNPTYQPERHQVVSDHRQDNTSGE